MISLFWLKLLNNRHFWLHEKIEKKKPQRNEKEEKKCEEKFRHEQYLLNC
jgi:hypothetical protein